MMEFERENPTCKFSVPDRPTVRQQLQYFSLAGFGEDSEIWERYWLGAQALIEDWECETLPDKAIDIDKIDSPDITTIIIWVGVKVRNHLDGLENISKKN